VLGTKKLVFELAASNYKIFTLQAYLLPRLINVLALRFKWPQSTFAYDILSARHLNFNTCFTKNVNISGTKQD